MHIFMHLQTRGICGKHHLHDSNVVGTAADFVDQNSSSEKEITQRHADVIISSFPSVSYNLFLFPLFSFKLLHGHSTRTDGSTIESIEEKKNTSTYFPFLQLCSEEASVSRLLYYHPSLLTFPLKSKALLPACVLLLGGQRSGYKEMCWTFCKGPLAASTNKVTYFFSGEKVTEEQLGHFPHMSHARWI